MCLRALYLTRYVLMVKITHTWVSHYVWVLNKYSFSATSHPASSCLLAQLINCTNKPNNPKCGVHLPSILLFMSLRSKACYLYRHIIMRWVCSMYTCAFMGISVSIWILIVKLRLNCSPLKFSSCRAAFAEALLLRSKRRQHIQATNLLLPPASVCVWFNSIVYLCQYFD